MHHCIEHRQLDFIQRIGQIAYWEYNPAQQTITLSEAGLGVLGSILGGRPDAAHDLMAALPDEERQRFQSALDQAYQASQALQMELRVNTQGGRPAYLAVRGAPVELAPGQRSYAGTFQNITDQRQHETDHEQVITQLQALLDALPQGVSVVDQDLRLILWNRRIHDILDLSPELTYRYARFEDIIRFNAARGDYGPGDPQEQVKAIVDRARQFLPHRFERKLNDGRIILVEGFPFRSGGQISGFVTTYTDITEQRHSEEQLTRQRDVMKTVIDNFPGGISLCDTDLRFTTYNDQFRELLDFPETLFSKGWVDFEDLVRFNVARGEYGPGDPEEQVQASLQRAHNFQAHHIERMRPNGRWLEIRGTPIASGGFVTSYVDITERKRIESELLQAKESAETSREQVARLLDNSGQGFLSFGPDLVIDAQYSLACESMLGCSPAGCHAPELFFRDDPAKADLLCTIITSVLETADTDVRESMLSLLPAQIERDGLILKMEYKALDNAKFMLVLTDITTERRMAALLESERRRLELIVMAVSDSRNFFETIDAFRTFLATGLARLLQSGTAPVLLAKELYREIHTYKGLLSQFSFPGTPQALHEIETQLASLLALGEALSVHPLSELLSAQALQKPFEADLAMLSEALGEDFLLHGDSIVLSDAQARQLEALAIRLLRGETVDTSVAEIRALLQEIGTLRKVSFKDVLLGFDGLVRQAAKRMDKEVAPLQVTGGEEVWIDPNDYRAFLHSLVHVFRNAVAHGIESPEQRWEAQKDEMGKISCSVAVQGHSIHLSIADDGAGLNLAALRQRALANKIYTPEEVAHIPDETIAQLVFVDAISTQDEVNELAGRGMGLAAVQSETRKLGGDVLVKTTPAQGTQLVFTLPLRGPKNTTPTMVKP